MLEPERFNSLTILEELEPKIYRGVKARRERVVRCTCDCGKEVVALYRRVKYGWTKACRSCSHSGINNSLYKHGGCVGRRNARQRTPEYAAWISMIARCYDQNARRYEYYGGKGIKVCERWLGSFADFLADMGRKPGQEYSIDRWPNNKGDYEPENCRWATSREQRRNTTVNVFLTFDDRMLCVADWAVELGTNKSTIYRRVQRGYNDEEALFGVN